MEEVVHLINTEVIDKAILGVTPNPANSPLKFDYSLARQAAVVWSVLTIGGYITYFLFCSISYLWTFKLFKKHYFPYGVHVPWSQLGSEIWLSCWSIPIMTALTVPLELLTFYGYTRVYFHVADYGMTYLLLSPVLFLVFTDSVIYWVHRYLHHPLIYASIHKPHHTFKEVTPFSALSFHPVDGWAQGLAYHLFVLVLPFHSYMYLGALVVVNMWTVNIHDRWSLDIPTINGAAHHDIHHRKFNYNYGQYFTFWDRLCGTYIDPDVQRKEDAAEFAKKQKRAAATADATTTAPTKNGSAAVKRTGTGKQQ